MSEVRVDQSLYTAARERAVYLPLADSGYLRVGGEDRRDWLQRQTSNDVRLLTARRAVRTVLTSPTARILDVLLLLDEGEHIGVAPLPGRHAATLRYLRGRIFFMDKVTVSDASATVRQWLLEGPQAAAALARLDLPTPTAVDEVTTGEVAGHAVRVVAQPGIGGLAYRVLVPTEGAEAFQQGLKRADVPEVPAATYEVLRVEAGLPAVGHELTEDFVPLEVGLEDLLSENKGCYPGQEVIARQITYDKIARRLVGLRPEAPVTAGATVQAEGKPAGKVTSAVISPRLGPIALAVLRRPYHEPGATVQVLTEAGPVQATVTALPFSQSPISHLQSQMPHPRTP